MSRGWGQVINLRGWGGDGKKVCRAGLERHCVDAGRVRVKVVTPCGGEFDPMGSNSDPASLSIVKISE